jgi:hypothetical protein
VAIQEWGGAERHNDQGCRAKFLPAWVRPLTPIWINLVAKIKALFAIDEDAVISPFSRGREKGRG